MNCYDCAQPTTHGCCTNRACPSCVTTIPAPAPMFAPWGAAPGDDPQAREIAALRDANARLTSRLDLLEQRVLELAAMVRR